MAIVRYKRDPAKPATMSPEQRAYHDALTEAEIQAAAESDPDNPPMTDTELAALRLANPMKRARAATGLSQAQFARRYRINVSRVRDMEHGRWKPDEALVAYLLVIERETDAVNRALAPPERVA